MGASRLDPAAVVHAGLGLLGALEHLHAYRLVHADVNPDNLVARPDGSVNPGQMTSFNHYALGAVGDWLHRVVGGLAVDQPGYKRIAVAPRPGGGLTWARSRLRTPYGMTEASWHIEDERLVVRAIIPPNSSAMVLLPGSAQALEVGSGQHEWTVDPRA